MKVAIEAKNREDAAAIRAGMSDPVVRAIVVVSGILSELPSDRARIRAIQYVQDRLAEDAATKSAGSAA